MRKYLLYILILITITGNFSTSQHAVVQAAVDNTQYKLLAPLPCPTGSEADCTGTKLENFNAGDETALGKYLNLIVRLVIGISAVLAVVMIVMGSIEYMSSELISSKEAGKDRIKNALFGLLIALSAYALLNTINPDLLNSDVNIDPATVTVTLDQANFANTEKTRSAVGPQYEVKGLPSAGVREFTADRASLSGITVDTANKTASFCKGTNCVSVPINVGFNGVAQAEKGRPGDSKTPIGTTTISGDIRIGSNGNAVISQNGYNLGAAFINLGIKDPSGNNRGIGFHGSYNDSLGTTNGCIRMRNADLLVLAPYIKQGLRVTIK